MSQHTTTYVGLDVSKASISVALLRPDGRLDEESIPNTPEALRRLVRRWPEPTTVRACYEAGPTGYDLHRQLTALGIETTVIAPSLTPRRPGDRIKTDRRDARKLAGLFRADELTAVRVPTPTEEAVRDLLRARQDEREDILRARHRLSKFLLRHGRVYTDGSAWTGRHTAWLTRQHFEEPAAQRTLEHYRAELDMRLAALKLLDAELLAIAHHPPFAPTVARLCTLRGIAELSALTIAVEVGDFTRFGSASAFMAFVGLVPSERSSGERRSQGPITKAGNAHVRRVLVEAAWHARRRPNVGPALAKRLAGQPPEVLAIATTAQRRLHDRYWRLVERRKPSNVAVVAVARELSGFCWALGRAA
ncbi:MAG TPA: IS110 family transposase [Anaerolineae bacterium]|jgi:transposase|nr:IS110 family transposase [Anaerolineae bacterium]